MEKRCALTRLIICYFLCLSLIITTIYGLITQPKILNKSSIFAISFADNVLVFKSPTSTPAQNENLSSIETETSQITPPNVNSNSSILTSATAVKGNVIEKYISPYTAPLSYNGVYVKNNTPLNINIKNLILSTKNLKILKNNQPEVLIIHTHATETFLLSDSKTYGDGYNSRTTDKTKNMVAVGEIVAKKLNSAGIKTLHDTTLHDYPNYSGSYSRSANTINSYLKKYKSIKIVLDLHRDSVTVSGSDKAKLVTKINGKKAAQVMIVMGSQSQGAKNHPNWQENLKLALKLQQTIEAKYPTLARPLSITTGKYNQNLSTGAMLIEFGTDMNSLDEVKYSAELVGESLVSLLNTLK